jgi:hypothetical protein
MQVEKRGKEDGKTMNQALKRREAGLRTMKMSSTLPRGTAKSRQRNPPATLALPDAKALLLAGVAMPNMTAVAAGVCRGSFFVLLAQLCAV